MFEFMRVNIKKTVFNTAEIFVLNNMYKTAEKVVIPKGNSK